MKDLLDFLDKYNIEYTVDGDSVIAGGVYLENLGITTLPESIGNLKCQHLDLQRNKLTSLPESIGNLKCEYLNLRGNNLTSLPESIGNLRCEYLNLLYNKLTSLPESIGNLKCQYLDLAYNNLTSLPASIGSLKCQYLNLRSNNLTSLPESIGNLKCQHLDLQRNKLTSLPESIGNLKCKTLNLSSNNLTSLPASIGSLKCQYLNLRSNNLTSLPESIGNLKCQYLNLRSNKLTSQPIVRCFGEFEVTDEYIYCDGILTWYSRKKAFSNYTVYVGYFGNYVVVDGDKNCAHGNSIRQCIADIAFKKSARDSSEYKGIDMDEQYPLMECIVMYRSITGACSGGVEMFMQKQKEIKDTYSVNEIIGITDGNYGHDQFVQFFDEES